MLGGFSGVLPSFLQYLKPFLRSSSISSIVIILTRDRAFSVHEKRSSMCPYKEKVSPKNHHVASAVVLIIKYRMWVLWKCLSAEILYFISCVTSKVCSSLNLQWALHCHFTSVNTSKQKSGRGLECCTAFVCLLHKACMDWSVCLQIILYWSFHNRWTLCASIWFSKFWVTLQKPFLKEQKA